MTFLNGVYIGVLLVVYLAGVVLSGKFYRWAYQSDVLFFELDDMEFFLSAIWFISVPVYFIFLMIFGVFSFIWFIYNRYV